MCCNIPGGQWAVLLYAMGLAYTNLRDKPPTLPFEKSNRFILTLDPSVLRRFTRLADAGLIIAIGRLLAVGDVVYDAIGYQPREGLPVTLVTVFVELVGSRAFVHCLRCRSHYPRAPSYGAELCKPTTPPGRNLRNFARPSIG